MVAASPDKANWDKNLFAYCDNDPVSRKDDGGDLWEEITTLGDSIFRSALIFGGLAIGAAGRPEFWIYFSTNPVPVEYTHKIVA